MLRLTFLGTGSAFSLENYQSNMLLETDKRKMLIDCGNDARHALSHLNSTREKKISYRDITDVYISHLHADHIGGLEWLAFCSYFDPNCQKPNLYASGDMLSELWLALYPGLRKLNTGPDASLSTYFNPIAIKPNQWFNDSLVPLVISPTLHVTNDWGKMPSYSLLLQNNIWISTDTNLITLKEAIEASGDHYNLIFHDCETSPYKSGVHAHYSDLCELPPDLKARIWLYHYSDGPLPDAKADGFRGFVKKGQCFDLEDPSSW